jgi:hypothetical protein
VSLPSTSLALRFMLLRGGMFGARGVEGRLVMGCYLAGSSRSRIVKNEWKGREES